MKCIIRITALLMFFLLLLGMFFGCSNDVATTPDPPPEKTSSPTQSSSPEEEDQEVISPLICEPGEYTLSYWYPLHTATLGVIRSYEENPTAIEAEKRLGVHIDWIHPSVDSASERYNLMFTADDLPDMIHHTSTISYYAGPDAAINDGYFIPLNDYMDKYAPNYKALLESDSVYYKAATTDSGKIWSFILTYDKDKYPWVGTMYRKDVFEKCGLEQPVTISDWEHAFDVLQSNGWDNPLAMTESGFGAVGFMAAFDAWNDFFQIDGKVYYGPITEGYKDFLICMRQWYEKGYIHQDTQNDLIPPDLEPDLANNKYCVIASGGDAAAGASILATGVATDPDFYMIAAPYTKLTEGQKTHLRFILPYGNTPTVVTTACETPEIAIQWCDYFYSEEGAHLANWGVEGVTYNIVNGEIEFTDLMVNNDSGLSFWYALQTYTLNEQCTVQDSDVQYGAEPAKRESARIWYGDEGSDDWMIPKSVTRTQEEGERYSAIMNDIRTLATEFTISFILGRKQPSDFDDYVAEVEKMKIAEAISIQEAAYARYLNR